MMKKKIKTILFLLIIVFALFLNNKYKWSSQLTDSNNIRLIGVYVEQNYGLSVVLYLIFTVLGSSILLLPGVSFAIISTGLFGPFLGSLYCLLGTSLGALVSFVLSRYLLKDTVKELVKKNQRLYNIIYRLESEKEILILMITRLLPIFPFNLQNFAYGITNISAVKYTVGTFIFMIPGIFLFSFGTEGIINKDSRNTMFIIAGILLLLTGLIGSYLYKKYKNMMVEDDDER